MDFIKMKIIKSDTRKIIADTLRKYVELIVPTYGPAGKKVLIATNEFSLKAADDGHSVSAEVEFENEFENAVAMYIREITGKTNSRVGDGTTTSVILTNAIVSQVMKDWDDPFAKTNYYKEVKEIENATKEAVEYIKSKAKKIETSDELFKVAYNSYNNEPTAKLIAETLFKIGRDGVLVIEDSPTAETLVEVVEGVEIEKGFVSPYFINTNREEVALSNPTFVLLSGRLERFMDMVPLLKKLVDGEQKKEIVIIAEGFSEDVIGTMIVNKIRGYFTPLLVETPGYGELKLENLKNLAAIVGATIFDGSVNKLIDAKMENVGTAKKIISNKNKTTIIGGNEEKTKERIEILQKQLEETKTQFTKDKLEKTIASLRGGIALIKVGANTENEQKSIKLKVEDAVNATKVAFKDGVVIGAGKTFLEIQTNSELLNDALKAPRTQLEENGKEFLDEDVFDPAGVLIAALETASSIACGLLTMGGIIATKRKEEKE